MDIRSGSPAGRLSNFSPHPFIFDGVECASMEGLLQSFKFDKPHIQAVVCQLVGIKAKRRGQKRNKAWKTAICVCTLPEFLDITAYICYT